MTKKPLGNREPIRGLHNSQSDEIFVHTTGATQYATTHSALQQKKKEIMHVV